jgi:hypothetical protein
MPDDSLRLAVLVDADNASAAVIGDILSEVASPSRTSAVAAGSMVRAAQLSRST